MLDEDKKRDKLHIINLIGKRSDQTPNFALLIGAGASVSSAVKPANQMIAEWRRQLYEQTKSGEKFQEWLEKQDWFEDEEEYLILFEKVYDQRSQRRIYIEDCVKDAKPSWGYIYLANIIAHGYFNITFTPNFDDLFNDACFLYADLRPIVCAHDSAVADIRVTSARPKIIKLHGDFLYDSIKNTVKETETLEENMREKFKQFASEYGLVVIGYGGNDRSIMDNLDLMLRTEGYFPNGLYWCRRKNDKVSKKLKRLMRREKTYWVEIDGFDEFMAELHEGLNLKLPDAVGDPYKATTERLNQCLLSRDDVKHEIIKKDISQLGEQVKEFEQIIAGGASSKEGARLIPFEVLGILAYQNNNFEEASSYFERGLQQNPSDIDIMIKMVELYAFMEKFNEALELSKRLIAQAPGFYESYYEKGYSLIHLDRIDEAIKCYTEGLKYVTEKSDGQQRILVNRSNAYLMNSNWEEALRDTEKALEIDPKDHVAIINKSIALKKLNKEKEAKETLQEILPEISRTYLRACAFAVLSDKDNMLKELEAAIEEAKGDRMTAKFDPEFADYRNDRDFRKLVYGDQEENKRQ